MEIDWPPYPLIANMPPPGPARRRALRAAGINLTLADFTAEERQTRGFNGPIRPEPPTEGGA